MPLYEYECQSCHRRTERIQKFSDPPLEVCPHCGGKLEKLISSPAFQFKGTGWYVTDYAKKSEGGTSKSEPSEKSDKTDKSEKPDKSDGSDKTTSTKPSDSSSAGPKDTSKSTT
jgi:putative FmdB family regulatory protein